MNPSPEFDKFNAAMDTILKANPIVVKAAMKEEKRERATERRAKRASVSDPASGDRG